MHCQKYFIIFARIITCDYIDFVCRDQNRYDEGYPYYIHGLCCCLQVGKYSQWSLHSDTTELNARG